MKGVELARAAAEFALTKKAKRVRILGLGGISDVADYFVVCSGESDTQVKAIADAIEDGLRSDGVRVWKKEGTDNLLWVLLDYVDVVVHIFVPKVRDYYDIERLWGDAKVEEFADEE